MKAIDQEVQLKMGSGAASLSSSKLEANSVSGAEGLNCGCLALRPRSNLDAV